MDEALSDEGLSFDDARLLLRLPRDTLGDPAPTQASTRARRQLRRLIGRGLAEARDGARGPDAAISERGREVLLRLERARTGALIDLVAGLEPSQQLRLQGAMQLISDRFSGSRLFG
ncbi:MAG: hypothetical protein ACXWED_03550 [Solirubrobacterales bacterium]